MIIGSSDFAKIKIRSKQRRGNPGEPVAEHTVLFGCNQSPFLLGATLEKYLKEYEDEFPKEVAEIRQNLYVD